MRILNEDKTEELFLTKEEMDKGILEPVFLEDNEPVYIYKGVSLLRTNEIEIVKLKHELSSTDYKAIKYSEGLYTNEEYEPIKKERQILRDKINKLQKELDELCNKDKEK